MPRNGSTIDHPVWWACAAAFLMGMLAASLGAAEPARADDMPHSDAKPEARGESRSEAGAASDETNRPVPTDERLIRRAKVDAAPRTAPAAVGKSRSAIDAVAFWWPAAVVLMLIVLAAIAARRWIPQARHSAGAGALKVLARQHLSGKHSLCLIRLGRGLVLVGVTSDRIQTISEIRDPEEAAVIVAAIERSRSASFTSAFNRLVIGAEREERGVESSSGDAASLRAPGGSIVPTGESIRRLARRVQAMTGSLAASAEPM